jgi:hypothetical protein
MLISQLPINLLNIVLLIFFMCDRAVIPNKCFDLTKIAVLYAFCCSSALIYQIV